MVNRRRKKNERYSFVEAVKDAKDHQAYRRRWHLHNDAVARDKSNRLAERMRFEADLLLGVCVDPYGEYEYDRSTYTRTPKQLPTGELDISKIPAPSDDTPRYSVFGHIERKQRS